jgi:hypothetical protein
MNASKLERKADIRRRYLEFRAAGETASQALRSAKIERTFERLESAGCVKIDIEQDSEPIDRDYFDDDWYKNTRQGQAAEKRTRSMIERDGVECWVGRFRPKLATERWEVADSICGCIGYDDHSRDGNKRRFSGYWADIQEETVRRFTEARREFIQRRRDQIAGRCPHCHGTGKAS